MSQLIKWNNNNGSYEQDDVIDSAPDDHQWSDLELNTAVFSVEINVTLSESDLSKLKMEDERPDNFSAISQLPTFRSLHSGKRGMKVIHRRKYYKDGNTIILKPNAQVHD